MEIKNYPELPVLVVDDEKNFLKSIEFQLISRGISKVETCEKSEEVMPRLNEKNYSVVLLDVLMDGISGEKLLSCIIEKYPDLPVIMLTGLADVATAVKCMKNGAFDYLTKPLNMEILIKTINDAINKRIQKLETEKVVNRIPENDDNNFSDQDDERNFITTIYFREMPPEIFYSNEDEQGKEKDFLNIFFQLIKRRIDIEKSEKEKTTPISIKLEGIEGLIFCYLAYKNYKALKNFQYRYWNDIPDTNEFRFSAIPENNNEHIPEWEICYENLKRKNKNINDGDIRQYISVLRKKLKELYGIEGIIDSTPKGRGNGYLLKGSVEFSLKTC